MYFKMAAFIFCRMKGRRKEKESPTPVHEEYKLYLEDEYVRDCVFDSDLSHLITLPAGISYEEWLATHSKY